MDRKTVFFVLSVFVFRSGGQLLQKISNGHEYPMECKFKFSNVLYVEWVCDNCTWPNATTNVLILNYSMVEKKVTYIHPLYKNDFKTTELKPTNDGKFTYLTLTFRGTETWHSAKYACRYRLKNESDYFKCWGIFIFESFEHQLNVTPCKDHQNVRLWCKVFELDVQPQTITFNLPKEWKSLKSPVYKHTTTRRKHDKTYYNITGTTVASLKEIGDLPKTIQCKVTVMYRYFSRIERTVDLTEEIKSNKNTINCLPNLQMEKHQKWEKVEKRNVTLRCIFDIPHEEEISMIEWFHHDSKENHFMYNWTMKTGQNAGQNYANKTFTSIAPVEYKGRNATTVTFKRVMLNYTGNYTCKVTFSQQKQSTKALLVVYQLPTPFNFKATRCRDNKTAGLECKALNIRPKPEMVAFYVFNPNNKKSSRMDSDVYVKITEENGFFAISAKMIAPIQRFQNMSVKVKAKCEVILHSDSNASEMTLTDLADPDTSENKASPSFSAIGCSDERVRLECKDDSVYPAPLEVVFSLYDPRNRSLLKLNSTGSTEIKQVNGYYNLNAKMFTRLDQLNAAEVTPKVICDVILDRESEIVAKRFTMRTTYVTDSRGKHIDVCSPNVEMEQRIQWVEVGTEFVSMRCKFDLPLHDEVESVEWCHHHTSQPSDKSQITIKSNYGCNILPSSWIDDTEGRTISILKLDEAKIEYSGSYFCKVNYRIAGNASDNGDLVVYQIQTPYYFSATINEENETLLECKAGNLYPSPHGIEFSKFDPATNLKLRLNEVVFTEIIEENGLFNISANMSIKFSESGSVEYVCDLVLSEDPLIVKSAFSPTVFNISDIYASEVGDKQKITIIIATSAVGVLVLAVGLAYVLKRFWSPCARDKSSREENMSKSN